MTRGLFGVLVLAVASCSSPEPRPEAPLVLDLAADLDRATIYTETGFIDIGTQAASAYLGNGFSWNQRDKSGRTLAWSTRDSSIIHFVVADTKPIEVGWHCKPFRSRSASVTSLSVHLNGHLAATVPLSQGWNDYTLALDTQHLEVGVNDLVFRYHWSPAAPEIQDRSAKRRRRVAVAWDWIRFPGPGDQALPTTSAAGILSLKAGSQVDFYLSTAGPTALVVDRVSPSADGAGVEITTQQDGRSQETERLQIDERLTDLEIQVSDGPGIARLRLAPRGDVALAGARVVSTAEPAPESSTTRVGPTADVPRKRPSLILLYVIDTLRADYLTPYDSSRETSPGLARLATDAVVFEDALAHSSWTKPTTASILTGYLPWVHGAVGTRDALTGELEALPHYLRREGFRTGGFSANGNVSEAFGFHHGFDEFQLMERLDAPATRVHDQALAWLTDPAASGPTFLYIHPIDPHTPYLPRGGVKVSASIEAEPRIGTARFMHRLAAGREPPTPELTRSLIELYDGEIAYSDRQFSDLIAELESLDLYDSSLVVVMSDHGEEFFDHGSWTHGRTLHQEVLRVPLLIKFPDNWAAGTRVSETVQQIDILPTILDYLAVDGTPALRGRSLLCAVQRTLARVSPGCAAADSPPVFANVKHYDNRWQAVVDDGWKLIIRGVDRLDPRAKLYDRRHDPREQRNLVDEHPIRVGYLTTLLRAEMHTPALAGAAQSIELDSETRERLEALGYLN